MVFLFVAVTAQTSAVVRPVVGRTGGNSNRCGYMVQIVQMRVHQHRYRYGSWREFSFLSLQRFRQISWHTGFLLRFLPGERLQSVPEPEESVRAAVRRFSGTWNDGGCRTGFAPVPEAPAGTAEEDTAGVPSSFPEGADSKDTVCDAPSGLWKGQHGSLLHLDENLSFAWTDMPLWTDRHFRPARNAIKEIRL